MSDVKSGGCLCGASTFEINGPFKFAIQCYCRDCQHVSGGGHLPQIGVDAVNFSSAGAIKTYSQKADSGSDLYFAFCGDCGSPLTKATSKVPDLVFIYPGALDVPPDVTFEKHVFEASKQLWDGG